MTCRQLFYWPPITTETVCYLTGICISAGDDVMIKLNLLFKIFRECLFFYRQQSVEYLHK